MRRIHIVIAAFALSLVSAPAFAQVEEDSNEISLGFTLGTTVGSLAPDQTALAAQLHYGRIVLGGLQVGVDVNITGTFGDTEQFYMFMMPGVRYYFMPKNPRFTPYAGFNLGFGFTQDGVIEAAALDPHGGLMFFLTEDISLYGQLDYIMTVGGDAPGPDELSVLLTRFGLSLFF